jgi:hypothetical protein
MASLTRDKDASMPTPPRRCSTCRHFQPAPLWRKGWCRNPLLYAPHQNHLVDERDLDCSRSFGDYWEPIEAPVDEAAEAAAASAPVDAPAAPVAPPPATPVASAAPPADPALGRRVAGTRRPPAPVTPVRTQADYLRFAVPVASVLLLLVVYAIWTGLLFRSAAEAVTPTQALTATAPAAVPPAALPTATPTLPPTVLPTPRPTSPPTPTAPPSAPTVAPTPAGLRAGGAAVVDTGSTDGLRLRRDPGQAGVVLRSIKNGERLMLLEGPREVDGMAWWKVQYAGEQGWVAGAFIKPAP